MKLYLELSQDSVKEGDYGYDITFTIYEDQALTVKHDLSGYERASVSVRRFQESMSTVVLTGTEIDSTNSTVTLIPAKNSFLTPGIFRIEVSLYEGESKITTESEEFAVKWSGQY